jgi:thiol-disulfide isomerase/thioredoxin
MKNTISTIFFTLLFSNLAFGQTALKVGDKAPQINITDTVSNAPGYKNFENKFILLEFWATWCAPCLAAVPHINDLQEKHKDRKDLVFISMTYEKPEKILRTLNKIEFKSMVVSDQTKKAHRDFGGDAAGDLSVPYTVLIGNKGIVKWIGTPKEMNSETFENFINNKEILVEGKPEQINLEKKIELKMSFRDTAFRLWNDANIIHGFSLTDGYDIINSFSANGIGSGIYSAVNYPLLYIFSNIYKVPESQIRLPEDINFKNKILLYKNIDIKDETLGSADLKANLLNKLNLKEKMSYQNLDVYTLKIKDESKLPRSLGDMHDFGRNDTHFVFTFNTIPEFVTDLYRNYPIILEDGTKLKGHYDFIIKKGSVEDLFAQLEGYGLSVEKVNKSVQIYDFKRN